MKKFAVIDIGSNSVRLMFVADGKVLYKDLRSTRIGEGLVHTGLLQKDAVERSAIAVSDFYHQAKTDGAEEVFAFATSAVRSAQNRETFLTRVRELCALSVEVISGETEAEIGVLGALGNRDGALVDIGGASTEIVVKKDGRFIYKKSVDIGVVRIKDMEENAVKFMQNALSEFDKAPLKEEICAIGGTATTLTAQYLGLTVYDSNKVTGTQITIEDMRLLVDKLQKMSVEEIAKLPCMPAGRADVITGGAEWLYMLMQRFRLRKIVVSDRDNLEGYAIKKGWLQ